VKGQSQFDFTRRIQLVLEGRAVGRIDSLGGNPDVPSYVELGGRLAYRLNDRLDLYVAARNLLHEDHLENNDFNAQLAKRSVYGGIRVHF